MRAYKETFDVRFPEVDAYGVVWHGHYVLYFEVARNGLCAAGGLTPAEALAAGYKVPITQLSMSLKRPARLDDQLEVTCTLRPPETAKLVMDYEVRRVATRGVPVRRELLATGTSEQVFLNPKGELLLTLPAPVRILVARVLAFQRGEGDRLVSDRILTT